MKSALDQAHAIVQNAALRAPLITQHHHDALTKTQAQSACRLLSAAGTLSINTNEPRPGLELHLVCTFEQDNGERITLDVCGEHAYRFLIARERSGKLALRVGLKALLDSDNAWILQKLVIISS
jgi:hypothetical protein